MARKHGHAAAARVSNAEFVIAAAVLVVIEAALLVSFLMLPSKKLADEARDRLSVASATLDRIESSKANAEQRESYYADLLARIEDAEQSLPTTLRDEDIAIEIGAFAAAHNVTISSLSFAGRGHASPDEYVASITQEETITIASDATASITPNGTVNAASDATASITPNGTVFAASGVTESIAGATYEAGEVADAFAGPHAPYTGTGAGADVGVVYLLDVQVNFTSEFHTLNGFLSKFEDGGRKVRVKSLSLSRVQEGIVKGALGLEYAALPPAEPGGGQLSETPRAAAPARGGKGSLFEKFDGYVEEGVDPTILLISSEDDVDPDFYAILNDSASNDTKVTFGVFPRTETEVYFNANNAVRAKLRISGDEDQFEYTYTLGSSAPRTEKRRLSATDGKLRVDVVSHPRAGENDKVALLIDIENETELPLEVRVRNDDVLMPRFYLGETKGDVSVKR